MAEAEEEQEGEKVWTLAELLLANVRTGEEPVELTYQCRLDFETEEGQTSVAFVPIAQIENRFLVAIPLHGWNRAVTKRLLPKGGLSKPVLVEVSGTVLDSSEEQGFQVDVKAWVGLLSTELANTAAKIGESLVEEADVVADFGDEQQLVVRLSHVALVQIADEHFSFVSAQSGGDQVGETLEVRMKKLEGDFSDIRKSLEDLPSIIDFVKGKQKEDKEVKSKKPSLPKGGKLTGRAGENLAGLDAAVVASARTAGVPEEQLRKLAELAGKPVRMDDAPKRKPALKGVLSESEEEEPEEVAEEDEGESAGGGGQAIEKAVLQLTKLVSTMAKSKQGKPGLEGILERAEGSSQQESSSSSQSGSRSKAAAYKKLKNALTDNPDWIWQNVESLMEEDFNVLRSGPGLQGVPTTSRSWLEHRSKLSHFQSSVRASWIIAGIHDCLKSNKVGEARARASLAMMAYDQAALDSGSWQLAQELLLELPPPYSAFQGRKAPDMNEQAWSRLADERFLELALWRLKDRDSFIESRKRLGQAAKSQRPGGGADKEPNPYQPKAKPKAKQKGKGAPKGERHVNEEAE